MAAPRERLGYIALLEADQRSRPDAIGTIDLDPDSPAYGQLVHTLEMPQPGDELHHFGWNACSATLCPSSAHPHVERRYLVVPGLYSSNIYIIDVKDDPLRPRIVKTIDAAHVRDRAGYERPHTVHCGPDALYVSALAGARNGNGYGPGGVFLMDHDTFEVRGQFEIDRGDQELAYDFWWHLGYDTMITSEWAQPPLMESGIVPEALLAREYGHRLHVWDLRRRKRTQTIDLGDNHQMVLELRPAHDPRKTFGFAGVVVDVENLAASVWTWYLDGDRWAARKTIEIPARPAAAGELPPLLQGFGAVPPLITDINLSLDDRFLYVSCWGTGELRQYDVSDPFAPAHTGTVELGGIARSAPHPKAGPLNGGPQMVELSRDGRRVYVSNSLYSSWDEQFYPEGLRPWLAKVDVRPDGGIDLDEGFLVDDFGGRRAHQLRLDGGDTSSDSFCYP
jgi:selenium-binding protein 1